MTGVAVRAVAGCGGPVGRGSARRDAEDVAGGSVPLGRGGETRSTTSTVSQPGDYRFGCTLHERQGQVGRLVVAAP